ncbi:MAG TPA: DUF2207 domain-containing protein [Thermoanaerobaculia bacterium]|nr:DUF2207 domain-containing protein [Thermoanaerobaculia bacterium]
MLSSIRVVWNLLLAFSLALPLCAQDRHLYWEEIAVSARLDARGTLHVQERQTFVFTGDWNGGERSFRVGLNHDLDLQRLARIDADGREIPLVEGDLDAIDHFEWEGNDTIRWRGRMPSDPLFQDTRMTYVLDYTLAGILTRDGDTYIFDHDFALPEIEWPIGRLVVDLDLDPVWQPLAAVPAHFEERNLGPGSHAVVHAELKHSGAGAAPAAGISLIPAPVRRGAFAASLLAMVFLYVLFRRHEAKRGRFDSLPVPREWDEEWLRENVFDLLPEEVGALWDQKIGAPEVAAVLARMVAEGKLESEVRPGFSVLGLALTPGVLRLRLKVDRLGLEGYEKTLIDMLFFSGSEETDTDAIRKRYRSTGFNPASVIEKRLRSQLKQYGEIGQAGRPDRRPTLYLALATLALFALDALRHPLPTVVLLCIILFGAFWLCSAGFTAASAWRKRTERLDLASLSFLIPGLLLSLWCALMVFHRDWFGWKTGIEPGLFRILGLALLPVAVWNSFLNTARSREKDETIQKRRLLGAARHLLIRELKSPEPRLHDVWLPYLLAFGLGRNVDRWFRGFGNRGTAVAVYSGTSPGASSTGSSTWSGGGGHFGGAGAMGAWSVAATGMAAGVSAPSSSGSGGGGGGGGGSSGGGGGGGW